MINKTLPDDAEAVEFVRGMVNLRKTSDLPFLIMVCTRFANDRNDNGITGNDWAEEILDEVDNHV